MKNFTIILQIALILPPLFSMQSCKDDPRPQLFVDQMTKDYVVFKAGSWWSYEELKSFANDTVTVEMISTKMSYIEDISTSEIENTRIEFYWSSFGTQNRTNSTGLGITADYNFDKNIGIVEEQYPWFLFPNIVYIPFNDPGEFRPMWEYDTLRYEQFYDSLEVRGKMFYNVMELSSSLAVHAKKQKRIWWAKNVGRIQWENFGGEIWQVTNYQVIQ